MEEALYHGLETLGLPVLIFTGNAQISDCTGAAAELFQLQKNELRNRRLCELGFSIIDEDCTAVYDPQFPICLLAGDTAESISVVFGLALVDDGSVRWLQGMLKRSRVEEKADVYSLSLMDVTSLVGNKRAQHQIFQAKNQWETTVDALQDLVTIQDKDMRIVRANRKAHELFGYNYGDLQGKKCYEAFLGLGKPCRGCPVARTGKDGLPHCGTLANERLQCTFSMSSFPILDEDGQLNLVVHVARDITSSLRHESEKNRLMAAIEQTSESVVISDVHGEILYVNPAFEQTSGYSRQEATGQNINMLKSGVHDRSFYLEMWETLQRGKVWRGRLTNRRKNGSLFREDVTISPVLDVQKRIVNFVALKRDVTREELLERQLHQSMKMEALGTLAGGIAHDFNNILSAMIGYGEIAKSNLPADHPARQDIDELLAGGDRAVELVKQILTFSKQESSGQFRLFKLQYILKEIIKLLRPTLPSTIELFQDIDMTCGSIFADPGQIYQVAMNLCTNARQAIGDRHGRLSLRLSEQQVAPEAVGGQEGVSASYLVLEVADTGCGMDEETLARIFDPFFTTKKKEQGTGLGLAVVHGIIKYHHGEIQVTSTPGAGSTFQVYLAVDGREVHEQTEKEPALPVGRERVLVIDDESSVAEVIRGILTRGGYVVQTFYDPIEAVKFFRRDPGCCDLVITDMVMPNMTGAELAREFLSLRGDLPMIMMTGHSENFDRDKALRIGIKEFVLKPVKMNVLRQIVHKVLQDGKNTHH